MHYHALFMWSLGIEPRATGMLGKRSSPELHPQPQIYLHVCPWLSSSPPHRILKLVSGKHTMSHNPVLWDHGAAVPSHCPAPSPSYYTLSTATLYV